MLKVSKQTIGGRARANRLSAQRRSEIASNAATIRWSKIWMRSNNRKIVRRNPLTHAVLVE